MRLARSIVPILLVGAVLLSCAEQFAEPQQTALAEVDVQVTPDADTLTALGQTVQLTAVGLDVNQSVVPDVTFWWRSSNNSVVTVDTSGLVTAVGTGIVEVWAISSARRGFATITVLGPLGMIFAQQESYSGNCENRTTGSTCLGFEDGYVWLVYDAVRGWREHGYWEGHKIVSAIGSKAEHYHVLDTNLIHSRSY